MKTPERWPALPLAEWKDTYATLHMWTQIVGKVRLALSPWLNHGWQVPLYVSARGLASEEPFLASAFYDLTGRKRLISHRCDGGLERAPPLEGVRADDDREVR